MRLRQMLEPYRCALARFRAAGGRLSAPQAHSKLFKYPQAHPLNG